MSSSCVLQSSKDLIQTVGPSLSCGPRSFAQGSGYLCRRWAVPVLTAMDAEHDAGDFVSAIFTLPSSEEREKVEGAILSLVEVAEEPRKNTAEKHRACLLGRLNLADLSLPRRNSFWGELSAAKAIPAPTPRRTGFRVSAVVVDERTMIEDVMGVSTEPDAPKKFLDVHRIQLGLPRAICA